MVHMSMPRQGMLKMGLQSCCLLCDSPDIAGTPRCSSCIESHAVFRKRLDELPPENEVGQLARELLQMISSPQRWDNDDVHGPALKHIQFLAGTLAEPKPELTSEQIAAVFAKQAAKPKKSLISGKKTPLLSMRLTNWVSYYQLMNLSTQDKELTQVVR